MWFRKSLIAIVMIAGIGAVPATAEPLSLEPNAEWKLREYEDKCRISRTFGADKDQVTLWVDQGGEAPAYNLTAIGRPMRNPYGPNIAVQFAPEPEYFRAYVAAKSSKGRPVVSLFGLRLTPTMEERALLGLESELPEQAEQSETYLPGAPRAPTTISEMTPERLAAITELRLGRALMKPIVLKTGSLTDPLAKLQLCAEKVANAITRNTALAAIPPQPTEVARWAKIIQEGYPKYLIRAGEEASVSVRLTINKTGRPSYCEVTAVEGLTSFNDTVCLLLLRHATFNPALNAEGQSLVAQYSTRVTFRLN